MIPKPAERGGAAAIPGCPRCAPVPPRGAAPPAPHPEEGRRRGPGSALPARPPSAAAEGVAWGCALPPEWLAAAAPEPSLGRS